MDTTEQSSCVRREFRVFFVFFRSLLNRFVSGHPTEIHTLVRVYYVFLTKSPCLTLKEKWWRFCP